MNSKFALLIFTLLIWSTNSHAQVLGASLDLTLLQTRLEGSYLVGTNYTQPIYEFKKVSASPCLVTVRGTFDYALIKFSDEMSTGIHAAIGLGGVGSNKLLGIDGTLAIEAPILLTFRMGNRSTIDSQTRNGFGTGLGYCYTFMALPYHGPVAFIEYSIKAGKESKFLDFGFKIQSQLVRTVYYADYTSEGLVPIAKLWPLTFEFNLGSRIIGK